MTAGNYQAIRGQNWRAYDLVTKRDRIIDMTDRKAVPLGKALPVADPVFAWSARSGRLARPVCRMEDGETPDAATMNRCVRICCMRT
ncbi:MAG: hypothetical protein GXY70_00065 [Euryarchaeota archaeon]|nr:hypothetical protein [Euryarchaeota archaeon]